MTLVLPPLVEGLTCARCDRFTHDAMEWTCAVCGFEARMDVVYAREALQRLKSALASRPFDMWRYREVLPVPEGAALLPITVGGTPVVDAPRLARALDVGRVFLLDEGRNPSASLKDRPSALGVVLARAMGSERIVAASTGNAASSTACAAASVGLPATIFVPRRAPAPKIAQLRVFGAQVLRVDADYDTTWELCQEVATGRPWFNRNCAQNPYLVEGKKTHALELAERLSDTPPDWVVLSVGDGCTIAGAVKGLEEAYAAGIVPAVPRVLGVQAAGAAPLVRAFDAGATAFEPGPADSIADSISVGHPRNGEKALRAVARNHGAFVAVSDDEILDAEVRCARLSGVFGEPAAAAAVAGVVVARARGIIRAGDTVAVVVSGNGLKDTDAALRAAGGPVDVAATKDAVLEALARP